MTAKPQKMLMLHGIAEFGPIPNESLLRHGQSADIFRPKTSYQRVSGYGEPKHDEIRGLQRSIEHILDTLEQNGPFIGIVGFSSGAAITAIIASLLEKRGKIYGITLRTTHPQLRFAICLSGFKLENRCYESFYSPKIVTPIFHTIGVADATISPLQKKKLARRCKYPWIYEFCGGHYVPQSKEILELNGCLASFLREVLGVPISSPGVWVDIERTTS